MSDPDRGGLRGEWGEQFPDWRRGLARVFDDQDRVPVKILVWGPGPHSSEYEKREQIIQHLTAENANNQVVTSELLQQIEPRLAEYSLYEAEELEVDIADVIFVLILKEKAATGAPAEVVRFLDNDEFRHKAHLFTPKLTRDERRHGFLDQGWVHYPTERRFPYTYRQYVDCTKMRSYCSSVVKELRKERFLKERRLQRLGSAPGS